MKTIRNASSGITGIRKWSSGLQASITSSGIVTGMVIFFLIICGQKSFSQGVGISEISITPDASSILELRSTLRGLLTPRMTTGQRDAIVTPGTGLIIYNTTTNAFNYYNGSTWIAILNTGTGVTAINGTLNRISVGGTPTVPVIDIDASYAGQGSITTLGTITNGIWNSTRIGLAYGGTNSDLSGSAAIGDLLYANTATTFARLAGVGTGNVLISGGVGTAPLWGKIGLTTHVTGTLPIANGGTGSNTQNFVDLTTAQTIGGAKTFTGAISASNLSGTNTGDQTITLTGDVTGTGTGTFATTISNNAVTYGKIQAVSSTSRLLGSSSTTTPVQEITLGSGLTLTGTTLSSSGLGGTVTNFSSGNLVPLFTTSVATSTTTPTLSFSLSNAAAYTLFGNNTGAAAAPAYFSPLLASALFQNQGATTSVLHGNAAGNPSWGQIINSDISNGTIDLTAKVTGLLPIANGGTGSATAGGARTNLGLGNVENTSLSTWAGSTNITTLGTIGTGTWNATTIGINRGGTGQTTASTAFNALSPITTLGDMIYGSAANTSSRLAGNTSTTPMFLKQTGTGAASAAPVWSTISKIDIGLGNVENTALSTWTGSANITTLGTIGTGTWNGTTIAIANGGTGATTSAGARTNLGLGNVENTALSTWIGSTNITTLGTVGTGTWSGEIITGQYGGTGVANTGKTITLGGNLTTSGAFTTTLTTTANTSLTLPTSGTLATLAGNETLTNKTVNGLSLTSLPNGFSIAGGTVSATLTVPSNATVSGTNTGDQTLAGLGGVPTTRTINGKSLATDIVLGLASADFVNQGTTTTVLHGNAGGSPAFGPIVNNDISNGTIDLTTKVTGILPVANGGTGSATLNYWTLTGNGSTNPANNFVGTTDNQDLVFRANNTERARIVSATGDIKIGDANTGTLRSTKELVLQEDGDQYGTSILRIRNRNAENGAIFENPHATITLVDFIFRTTAGQRNIRYEARAAYGKTGAPSFHLGGPSPDAPTLALGDNYAAFNMPVRIGTYPAATVPIPQPTALLHLNAGTAAPGTAPLKFTSGTNLTTQENGAVEYDGTNFFATAGGTRYTLAKTLTVTSALDFPATNPQSSSDLTIAVPNAVDGDVVILGVPNGSINPNSSYSAWVSAANQVTVRFNNYSAAIINPAIGTFRVSVLRY